MFVLTSPGKTGHPMYGVWLPVPASQGALCAEQQYRRTDVSTNVYARERIVVPGGGLAFGRVCREGRERLGRRHLMDTIQRTQCWRKEPFCSSDPTFRRLSVLYEYVRACTHERTA